MGLLHSDVPVAVLGDFHGDSFVLADFSGDPHEEEGAPRLETAWVAWVFFFAGTLFFLVVLLNLLIAIMGLHSPK